VSSLLLLLIFFFESSRRDVVIRCDVIEENHKYDERGISSFTQIIFWKEYPAIGLDRTELRSCGFRILDEGEIRFGPKYCSYFRRETGFKNIIEVRAPIYRESWSKIDPESVSKRKQNYKDVDLIISYLEGLEKMKRALDKEE